MVPFLLPIGLSARATLSALTILISTLPLLITTFIRATARFLKVKSYVLTEILFSDHDFYASLHTMS